MTLLAYPNPDNVSTEIKNTALKYAYTYIVQELLRLKHNEMGDSYRAGTITQGEWEAFLRDWWEPRSQTVIADLLELRQVCQGYVAQFKDKIDLEAIPL